MMVFKNVLNDLKLNRISYLLEVIEKADFKKKVDAYNKLRKMKIDEDSGHVIIDKVMTLKHSNNDNFNSDISLLSLLFKNYYDSYFEHLYEAFKTLNTRSKLELLSILANSNDPSQLILYRTLIYSNYKELKDFPIGNIAANTDNYELVFPELFETFKENNTRNPILVLLNDFINQGVVPLLHINKYKKYLQKIIVNIFREGIKYKIDPKDNFMSDKEYIDLRIFMEIAINIEYYVSNKETKTFLDKLYKTKDNQLKLFILENYSRKGKDLSKMAITSIAKDNLSRAPLYSFLSYNNSASLMPKKYRNNKDLSLSDLYLNYCISNSYNKVPYDFELLEEKIVDDYKYYIYKFKAPFDYNEEIIDPITDYLLKNIKVDDALNENGEVTYLGISGGYNKNEDPSLIENPLDGIKITKYIEDYEQLVDKLIGKKEVVVEEEEEKESVLSKIFNFSRILSFFCFVAVLAFVVLVLYVSNVDLFNIRKNTLKQINVVHAVELKPKKLFNEIAYRDIFNREDPEYYVLFFKRKNKSTYYEYLNTILKKDYKVYYVDLSNEENKPIYEGNETGFIVNGDTLLKVINHEYSFYIVGKPNILNEFKSYVDEIKKQEEAERKAKEQEELEKKKQEEKEAKSKKEKKNNEENTES